MKTSHQHPTGGLPLLALTLTGALIAASCWWLASDQGAGAASVERELEAARPPPPSVNEAHRAEPGRSPVVAEIAGGSGAASDVDGGDLAPRRREKPRTERDFRERFLALEQSEPGALAAHADAWLDEPRSTAEKVGLLQALEQGDAPASIAWLERACEVTDAVSRTGTPAGSPVSEFALSRLARRAAKDTDVRAALARVASNASSVPIDLRRRAAAHFAACATLEELAGFESLALREPDENFRAGVAAALGAREDARDARIARMASGMIPADLAATDDRSR